MTDKPKSFLDMSDTPETYCSPVMPRDICGHGEASLEDQLVEANKRIDELEEVVCGIEIALRGLTHTGAELKQIYDESHCTTDKEHIESILCALKNFYHL